MHSRPAVARDIPFSMIQFALYEAIKSHLISTRSQPDLVAWENSAVGELY